MRIERKDYLNKLIALSGKQIIKVITGVRRCGKSTLLEIFQEYLQQHGIESDQIIAVNFEDLDNYELRDPMKLHAYVKNLIYGNKQYWVFFDEIQHCTDFPRVVDSLALKKNIDLYITGSNAWMLSTEIATMLSGRYVEIKMLPLSLREFACGIDFTGNLSSLYRAYIEISSFPHALSYKNQPSELRIYLDALYSSIVIKDISMRNNISDQMLLKSIIGFIYDNVGNLVSTKKIADTLNANGRKVDVKTIEKYLHWLTESLLVYQVKRYNIRGRQFLKTLDKYYSVDMGMRSVVVGRHGMDVGHVLENIIYLELLRRDAEVYVGKIDDAEIDFVARVQDSLVYIQVAATVRDVATLERELAPFRRLSDHYPKYLFSLDDDLEADYDGIRRIYALDWLMGRTEPFMPRG